LEITEDTGDYWRTLELSEITVEHQRLLEITEDYWGLLEITGSVRIKDLKMRAQFSTASQSCYTF